MIIVWKWTLEIDVTAAQSRSLPCANLLLGYTIIISSRKTSATVLLEKIAAYYDHSTRGISGDKWTSRGSVHARVSPIHYSHVSRASLEGLSVEPSVEPRHKVMEIMRCGHEINGIPA